MKRVPIVLATLFVIVVAVATGFILSFDVNRYKPELVKLVAARTGRSFAVDGDIQFVPAMVPTIALEGVRVGDAAWNTDSDMLQIKRIEARVALRPLLERRIEVKRIAISGITVKLASNADGANNWTFDAGAPQSSPASSPIAALAVDEVALDDLTLHYAAAASSADATVKSILVRSRVTDGVSVPAEITAGEVALEHRAGPRVTRLALATLGATSAGPTAPVLVNAIGTYGDLAINLQGALGTWAQLLERTRMPFDINGTFGTVTANAAGAIDPAAGLAGLTTTLELQADSAVGFNALLGTKLPAMKPASFKAALAPAEQGLAWNELAIKIGRWDLSGSGTVNTSGSRPAIHADLRAERLDLTEFTDPPKPTAPGARLFSTEPLALDALSSIDYSGTFHAGVLKTHGLTVEQFKAQIALAGGQLKLAPASANFAGGKLDVVLDIAPRQSPRVDVKLRATGIEPAKLSQLAGKQVIKNGLTNIDFTLVGAGRSVAEIAGTGNGRLLVQVGPGVLPKSGVGTASADLLLGALNGLNPLASSDPHTTLECAVLNFDINNGLASTEHGLALRTDKLNVIGGGSVDLKTERIDIGAKPKPREGIGLNLAAIGDFVRLGGTLSKPTPVTDAKGAATAGLKVGAALATGGLSLLAEGLFDRATSDEDVCAIASGAKPLPSARQPATPAPASSATEKPSVLGTAADTTKNAVEGVGDAVKGVFKGLFGR